MINEPGRGALMTAGEYLESTLYPTSSSNYLVADRSSSPSPETQT